jgi:hypothetical protein
MKKLPKDSRIMSVDEKGYDGLLTAVSELLEQARHAAARSVNQILTATYWEIGRGFGVTSSYVINFFEE